jgi:hypothetical protein
MLVVDQVVCADPSGVGLMSGDIVVAIGLPGCALVPVTAFLPLEVSAVPRARVVCVRACEGGGMLHGGVQFVVTGGGAGTAGQRDGAVAPTDCPAGR